MPQLKVQGCFKISTAEAGLFLVLGNGLIGPCWLNELSNPSVGWMLKDQNCGWADCLLCIFTMNSEWQFSPCSLRSSRSPCPPKSVHCWLKAGHCAWMGDSWSKLQWDQNRTLVWAEENITRQPLVLSLGNVSMLKLQLHMRLHFFPHANISHFSNCQETDFGAVWRNKRRVKIYMLGGGRGKCISKSKNIKVECQPEERISFFFFFNVICSAKYSLLRDAE